LVKRLMESGDTMSEFVTVATVDQVPDDHGLAVPLGERMIALFKHDGQYWAIDDLCPHMGASLADGEVNDAVVTCPWHAWRFDVRDGTWCDNRKLKIDRFEVRVVGQDIQVREVKDE